MTILGNSNSGRLRTSASFTVSGFLHGWILAWVGLLGHGSVQRPRSIYDQEIKPYEKHIIWYNLRDRLPEVAPGEKSNDPRPPRAFRKFDQSLVVGKEDDARPPQLISLPAPEIESPKMLPLPNVVAAPRPTRPVRLFAPPPEKPVEIAAPALPDAPRVATAVDAKSLAITASVPRPQPRAFTPPPATNAPAPNPALPDAPRVTSAVDAKSLAVAASVPRPQPRAFTPPATNPPPSSPTLPLPDAPRVTSAVDTKGLAIASSVPRPQPRAFTPPPATNPAPSSPNLPLADAPRVATAVDAKGLAIGASVPRPQPRAFTPPPGSPPARPRTDSLPAAPEVATGMYLAAAPALTAARRPLLLPPGAAKSAPATMPDNAPTVGISASIGNGEAAMAIVGLNPSKTTDFPSPPGSRQAAFSAGPQLRPAGASGSSTGAQIVVPGLLAQGGAKDAQPTLVASAAPTSRENLLAAARLALHPPAPDIAPPAPGAVRVATAPDPRLSGRVVYTVAIQMPNVTSYSGSWLVWFAEREPLPGSPTVDMRAPLPLRKVDPKYIAAAADERVEGKVRLAAVIRKDGHVDAVALLRHLDDRLDRSASEALAKWEFEPALRNGTAVDVDCVFEIPFRLAPRPAK